MFRVQFTHFYSSSWSLKPSENIIQRKKETATISRQRSVRGDGVQTALRTGPYDWGAQPAFDPERRHWQHTKDPVPLPARPVRLKLRADKTRWCHKIVTSELILSLSLKHLINNCNFENWLFSIDWNNWTKRSETQGPFHGNFVFCDFIFFSMKNDIVNLRCSLGFSYRLNVPPCLFKAQTRR